MSDDEAIFEVHTPTGHRFAVYASGEIVGFPEGCVIINRIWRQLNAARTEARSSKAPGDIFEDENGGG